MWKGGSFCGAPVEDWIARGSVPRVQEAGIVHMSGHEQDGGVAMAGQSGSPPPSIDYTVEALAREDSRMGAGDGGAFTSCHIFATARNWRTMKAIFPSLRRR